MTQTPDDLDPSHRKRQLDLMRKLGKHLIALSGTYQYFDQYDQPDSECRLFAFTSFIMSFSDMPILITAGHILTEYLEPFANGEYHSRRVKVTFQLCDFFGENPKINHPSPFAYESARWYYADKPDLGLDIAFCFLRPFEWDALKANDVEPITENMWATGSMEHFDYYKILGFPVEQQNTELGHIRPILAKVETFSSDEEAGNSASERPWFIGHLRNNHGLHNPEGMSGGPIFGFRRIGNDLWDCRVVGMQSRWNPKTRVIKATPLKSLVGVIQGTLARLRNETL